MFFCCLRRTIKLCFTSNYGQNDFFCLCFQGDSGEPGPRGFIGEKVSYCQESYFISNIDLSI